MDRKDCVRPARRTALIGLELQRYNIDIAALSETRLADTGSITEVGAGYIFFSGQGRQRTSVERQE